MTALQEAVGQTTLTLRQIWGRARAPEQYVLDMFASRELDVPLEVRQVAPGPLVDARGRQIRRLVRQAERGERAHIIDEYRNDPGPPIVLMGTKILDGHHRAMAAYLDRRPVDAVQVDDLPED